VTVTPASGGVTVGATLLLSATTKDAGGNVLTGYAITWASGTPAVATVSPSGVVSGVAVGSATITATSEGQSGTATIAVQAAVPSTGALWGVWWRGVNDVFVVGDAGTILHYDGTSWSPRSSGTTNALYAMGPDLVVVGAAGTIMQVNPGVGWRAQASGTTNHLYGLARTPPGGTIVVVGAAGTILHYTGTDWLAQGSGTSKTLYGVGKVPMAAENLAVGAGGTILHFDGANWSPQTSSTTNDLFGLLVLSGVDVYVLGAAGTLLHYNGTAWSPIPLVGVSVALRAIDAAFTPAGAATDFFLVGDGGTIMHSTNGSTWVQQTSGTTANLAGVGVVAPDDVFAVGAGGIILHYNGSAWSRQR